MIQRKKANEKFSMQNTVPIMRQLLTSEQMLQFQVEIVAVMAIVLYLRLNVQSTKLRFNQRGKS